MKPALAVVFFAVYGVFRGLCLSAASGFTFYLVSRDILQGTIRRP